MRNATDTEKAVAWRYRHKDTEGWSMLKNGRDPAEWLKQWPNTEYEVEALAPMRPEAADEIERLRNQLVKALEAVRLTERAEDIHANCDECGGEGEAEECEFCFPSADDARIARRAALAKTGEKNL